MGQLWIPRDFLLRVRVRVIEKAALPFEKIPLAEVFQFKITELAGNT
jgi:hypothetical protein